MAIKPYCLDSSARIYPIRGLLGCFHLLYDDCSHEAVLIDTGLVGEMPQLAGVLKSLELGWDGIKAILLTHGHIDHTCHLARLRELTGAPVLAHPLEQPHIDGNYPLEQPHIDGNYPYRGLSRVCGAMEAIGRWVLRYRSAPIDQPLSADMDLPYWGGLRVIHLPGHTRGHCGFYSQRFSLLFTGDLFASYPWLAHLPPPFLNSCPEYFDASLDAVKALAPKLIIPNHYLGKGGELHRTRFESVCKRR